MRGGPAGEGYGFEPQTPSASPAPTLVKNSSPCSLGAGGATDTTRSCKAQGGRDGGHTRWATDCVQGEPQGVLPCPLPCIALGSQAHALPRLGSRGAEVAALPRGGAVCPGRPVCMCSMAEPVQTTAIQCHTALSAGLPAMPPSLGQRSDHTDSPAWAGSASQPAAQLPHQKHRTAC